MTAITYNILPEDYADFWRYMNYYHPKHRIILRIMPILFLCIGVCCILLLLNPENTGASNAEAARFAWGLGAVLFLLSAIFSKQLLLFLYGVLGRWLYKRSGFNSYDTIAFQFDEHNIYVTSDKTKTELKWTAVVNVAQTENTIFFFIDKRNALLLPKRALESNEQARILFDQFTELFRKHQTKENLPDHLVEDKK